MLDSLGFFPTNHLIDILMMCQKLEMSALSEKNPSKSQHLRAFSITKIHDDVHPD